MDPTTRTAGGPARAPVAPGASVAGPAGRAAAVVLLVALAVLLTSVAGPWDPGTRQDGAIEPPPVTETPMALPAPTPDPLFEAMEQLRAGDPADLRWLGVALSALIVIGLVTLLVRWWRALPRRRLTGLPDDAGLGTGASITGPGSRPDLPSLREGVEDADLHLRSALAPVDAVIAAWVALEAAAERSGVPRAPAATPTEFTVEVLDRTPVDPTAIRRLLALYLQARFGTDPLGPSAVAEATAAVGVLAEGLAAGPDDRTPDDERPDDSPDGRSSAGGPR